MPSTTTVSPKVYPLCTCKARCRHIRTHKCTAKTPPQAKCQIKIRIRHFKLSCKDSRVLLSSVFAQKFALHQRLPSCISLSWKFEGHGRALPQYLPPLKSLTLSALTTLATASCPKIRLSRLLNLSRILYLHPMCIRYSHRSQYRIAHF